MKKLSYKDEEDSVISYKDELGNVMYGFSQVSLDKNTKVLQWLVSLGFSFFALILWLIWYVISNDVVNNIVAECV